MNLSEDVDLEEFVTAKDDLSGADIKAVCTEAGLLALRERRMRVTKADFTSAREKVCQYHQILMRMLTFAMIGVVPEERGHAGRTLPVICICFCCREYVTSRLVPLARARLQLRRVMIWKYQGDGWEFFKLRPASTTMDLKDDIDGRRR